MTLPLTASASSPAAAADLPAGIAATSSSAPPLPSPAATFPRGASSAPDDGRHTGLTAGVERTMLANGLTILVKPTTHAPVTTLWLWYRVGSRNEVTGLTGASHWVEHMLFKGTERYGKGEFDRLIAREGGVFNGMTWVDWTTYFVTLPADRIDLALDIEADRMARAVFDPDEVASERTVILAEREGHENHPLFQLGEEVQASAIQAHPYHHEVIGWRSDLLTMTRDDLYDHYRRFYHPANAVVVAVGAFDAAEMADRIGRFFGGLPAGPTPRPLAFTEPPQRGERRVTIDGDDQTSYFTAAYKAPAARDPDYFAFQVMDTILGGAKSMNLFGDDPTNRSSRLYQALVETELAAYVASGMQATIDPFLYTISAVVMDGADPAAVEAVVASEVDRLRKGEVTQDDVARAVKQAKAQFAYSAESVTNQGFWLGFAEVVADGAWLDGYLNQLESVTAEDVARVAARYLAPHQRTIGVYRPKQGGPGSAESGADETDGAGQSPDDEDILSEDEILFADVGGVA